MNTISKMNSDVKSRWIKALRSGKYTQGQAFLKRDGDHCCLGVLCEIEPRGGEWLAPEDYSCNPENPNGFKFMNEIVEGELPDDYLVEVGITMFEMTELISMNDSKGYTFEQIANHIEENL